MSENEVPPWLLKAAQEADAYVRQMTPMLEAAHEANAMGKHYLWALRGAQKRADEARASTAAAIDQLPPPPPELVQAMNVGLREMLSSSRQQRDVSVLVPVASTSGVALPPSVTVWDVGAPTDTPTAREDMPDEVAVPLDAKTVFLALLWVLTILLPLKIGLLPADVEAIIRDYLTTVSLALTIHWRVSDSRKN